MSWSASNSSSASSMESTTPIETPGTVPSASPSLSSDSQGEPQPLVVASTTPEQNNNSTNSSTSTSINGNKDRVTVPSACVQCRSKHLKCDGLNPCTRCSSNSFECVYVRSRRGFKGPRKNSQNKANSGLTNPVSVSVPTPSTPHACPLVHPNASKPSSNVPSGLVTPPENRMQMPPAPLNLAPYDIGQELVTFDSKQMSKGLDLRERCIESFFYHFYPAHPFLLPRTTFFALRKERNLDALEAALRYVGSFYVEKAPTTALGLEAERSIYSLDCAKDGYKVQAMLILTIGLDGYTFQEKALQILIDAQDLALELGMNTREFAVLHGDGSSVLEESWRRTWWELYIVDGMIAGVHQRSSFRLNEIISDVLLPVEEKEYASGQIPVPHSLLDFDDDSFDDRNLVYSSFTYRIAAIRNLGRVLASRQLIQADLSAIDRIDAYLVNWKLHLPESKKSFISSDGQLDEMIFQAHMISEATMILLHREHSQLDSSVAQHVTSCAPYKQIVPGESYNIHAAKTIQAAQDISKLISLPVPLAKHTHFFTCVVTLASIVHLSCWSVFLPLIHDDDLKQQLRLNTGALKTLWQIWPSAGQAFGQVKGVAQEMYKVKKHQAEVGYWINYTNDEVSRSMVEDRAIMEELQLLEGISAE